LPEVICDTSALQYLYQLDLLWVLEALAKHIVVPPAVVEELAVGRSQGIQLPDPTSLEWVTVRAPAGATVLPLVTDLGPGETEALALALESSDALAILDDGLARQVASMLSIRFRGTLGLLLDAKASGLVSAVEPLLDQLQGLGFRLHSSTREAILDLAGELSR
jgi:predicted nucleic acid-binding protein